MSDAEAIVGLGGRADFVAAVPNADPVRLALTPEERAVFACVGRASTIADVISRSGLVEAKAIATLLSLRAKGAIAPARVNRGSGSHASVDAALLEEVDLDPERKKDILEKERALEYQNHFELLGVDPDASADDARRAYHELSRKYHPDRFFKKNLGSFRARVEKIFKRITEAHATLADPQKRAAYLTAHPEISSLRPGAGNGPPESPERTAERKARLAQHPYLLRARKTHDLVAEVKALIAKGDHSKAMTELEQLLRIDPHSKEGHELMASVRKKQDLVRATAELQKAQESEMLGNYAAAANAYRNAIALDPTNAKAAARGATVMLQLGDDPALQKEAKLLAQKAVDGEPKNATYRCLLARVLLQAGFKKLAKKEFEEALKYDPANAEARAALRKLRWTF